LRGSTPALVGAQTPSGRPVLAFAQEVHLPSQAVAQQTPSTQKPLPQSAPPAHFWPVPVGSVSGRFTSGRPGPFSAARASLPLASPAGASAAPASGSGSEPPSSG